jgi:hypothetical protein
MRAWMTQMEVEQRRVAAMVRVTEALVKEQHYVWVDRLRPSMAWMIDRLADFDGVLNSGRKLPMPEPPRTPFSRGCLPRHGAFRHSALSLPCL